MVIEREIVSTIYRLTESTEPAEQFHIEIL